MNYTLLRQTLRLICLVTLPVLSLMTMTSPTFADNAVKLWETDGLKMPESVEYDTKRKRYYVSNVNAGPMIEDGNGSIAVLNDQGQLENSHFITGLHSPKGLALHGDKLYIADVKELTVVDLNNNTIVQRYRHDDIQLLNGITIDTTGQVFVSDWLGNSIYHLKEGKLELWLHDTQLNSPNGLWVDDDTLIIASWGSEIQADFSTKTSGGLLRISRKTKTITAQEMDRDWINMDGISIHSSGDWIISYFLKGEIILMDNYGKTQLLIDGLITPADFFYVAQKNQIIIPSFVKNQVTAYQLTEN